MTFRVHGAPPFSITALPLIPRLDIATDFLSALPRAKTTIATDEIVARRLIFIYAGINIP